MRVRLRRKVKLRVKVRVSWQAAMVTTVCGCQTLVHFSPIGVYL